MNLQKSLTFMLPNVAKSCCIWFAAKVFCWIHRTLRLLGDSTRWTLRRCSLTCSTSTRNCNEDLTDRLIPALKETWKTCALRLQTCALYLSVSFCHVNMLHLQSPCCAFALAASCEWYPQVAHQLYTTLLSSPLLKLNPDSYASHAGCAGGNCFLPGTCQQVLPRVCQILVVCLVPVWPDGILDWAAKFPSI